jgi:hypothetical protein
LLAARRTAFVPAPQPRAAPGQIAAYGYDRTSERTDAQSDPIGTVLYRDMAVKSLAGRGLVDPEVAARIWSNKPEFNHPYLYAQANPLSFVDPEGLQAASTGGRLVGGAIGGGLRGMGGGLLGAGIGAGLGAAMSMCKPTDRELCERECDAEYDRGRDFCRAMSGMRGRNRSVFQACMQQVDERYIQCYQDCSKQ